MDYLNRDYTELNLKLSHGGGGGKGGEGGNGKNGNNSRGDGNGDNESDDDNNIEDLQITCNNKETLNTRPSIFLHFGASAFFTSAFHSNALQQYVNTMSIFISKRIQSRLTWYIHHLESSPLVTKSITGGIIGIIGDALAQIVQYQHQPREFTKGKKSKACQVSHNDKKFHYNCRRGLATLIDNIFISGPLMHVGYDFFEKIMPITTATTSKAKKISISKSYLTSIMPSKSSIAALSHVFGDLIFLDSLFIATSMVTSGILEGYSIQNSIIPQIRTEYITNWKTSTATSGLLLPFEFTCFRYLPVRYRALAMNFADVIWDGVVSFMNHRNR